MRRSHALQRGHLLQYLPLQSLSLEQNVQQPDNFKLSRRYLRKRGQDESPRLKLRIHLGELADNSAAAVVHALACLLISGVFFGLFEGVFVAGNRLLGIFFIFLIILALDVFEQVPEWADRYLKPRLNMTFLKAFS